AALNGAKERRVGGVDQAARDLQRAALEELKRGPLTVGDVGLPGEGPLSHWLSAAVHARGAVAVLPGADVPGLVQGQPAQRGRPPPAPARAARTPARRPAKSGPAVLPARPAGCHPIAARPACRFPPAPR